MTQEIWNAETLARLLGGKRSGRQYVCPCPAHDDHNPSLIVFDGREKVQVRCLAGCDPVDVLRAINARAGGMGELGEIAPQRSKEDDNREAEAHAKLALDIFGDGDDVRGMPGEEYLFRRTLALPPGDCSHVIRYHPRSPRGRERQPALIVLMRDIKSNEPRAIQRIYLKPDCTKDGAMMLGPAGGCAMKLTSQADTFWDDMSYCPRLHICEGLEIGLALLMDKRAPVWALGSAGAIERFPVLFGVGSLIICADNDPPGRNGHRPGPDAGRVCKQRWGEAGRPVWMIMPLHEGADFADGFGGGDAQAAS